MWLKAPGPTLLAYQPNSLQLVHKVHVPQSLSFTVLQLSMQSLIHTIPGMTGMPYLPEAVLWPVPISGPSLLDRESGEPRE